MIQGQQGLKDLRVIRDQPEQMDLLQIQVQRDQLVLLDQRVQQEWMDPPQIQVQRDHRDLLEQILSKQIHVSSHSLEAQ